MTGFVTVAGLYPRETRSGGVVWFGQWCKTRLYLMPTGHDMPTYWLAVRDEDYQASKHGPIIEMEAGE